MSPGKDARHECHSVKARYRPIATFLIILLQHQRCCGIQPRRCRALASASLGFRHQVQEANPAPRRILRAPAASAIRSAMLRSFSMSQNPRTSSLTEWHSCQALSRMGWLNVLIYNAPDGSWHLRHWRAQMAAEGCQYSCVAVPSSSFSSNRQPFNCRPEGSSQLPQPACPTS